MRILGAIIRDNAQVTGRPRISDSVILEGDAKVQDFASLIGPVKVSGGAQVSGHAEVSKCILKGTVHVTGTAKIQGGLWTEGTIDSGTWIAPGVPFPGKVSL